MLVPGLALLLLAAVSHLEEEFCDTEGMIKHYRKGRFIERTLQMRLQSVISCSVLSEHKSPVTMLVICFSTTVSSELPTRTSIRDVVVSETPYRLIASVI